MSLRKTLATLFVFAVVQLGVLAGIKMSQEEIEKLMNAMHRTQVEHVVKKDDS